MAAARELVGAGRPARTQRISAEDAAALVRSGDWLDYGAGWASPTCSTPRWPSASASSTT